MKTLSLEKLSKTSSPEKLFALYQRTKYKSKEEKLVEKRMADVLKTRPPKSNDFIELFSIMKFTPYFCRAEKMIWGRMEEVLKSIESIEDFIEYWKITRATSREREIVEQRMAEIFKAHLAEIDNMSAIIGWWYFTSYKSKARKILQHRMARLVRKENDIEALQKCFLEIPVRNDLRKMIESQKLKVVSKKMGQ